jgi:hypothetical protein
LAGGVWTNGVTLVFENNIVWGNAQTRGDQFDFPAGADLRLGRNVVEGGINGGPPGVETLLTDPGFADTTSFALRDATAKGRDAQPGAYGGRGGAPLLARPRRE